MGIPISYGKPLPATQQAPVSAKPPQVQVLPAAGYGAPSSFAQQNAPLVPLAGSSPVSSPPSQYPSVSAGGANLQSLLQELLPVLEELLGGQGQCAPAPNCAPQPQCCEPQPQCCEPQPQCCEPQPQCCEPPPCEPPSCQPQPVQCQPLPVQCQTYGSSLTSNGCGANSCAGHIGYAVNPSNGCAANGCSSVYSPVALTSSYGGSSNEYAEAPNEYAEAPKSSAQAISPATLSTQLTKY